MNYLVSYGGAIAQSPSDAGADAMSAGDLETARLFGQRRVRSGAALEELSSGACPSHCSWPDTRRTSAGASSCRLLLPDARQRSVGPFIFFDHFGPAEELPGVNHDVRPHPHIGLATVTYLFDGAMMHRDSLGTEQLIEPGAINWMTAGRGIVHSERVPTTCASAFRQSRAAAVDRTAAGPGGGRAVLLAHAGGGHPGMQRR